MFFFSFKFNRKRECVFVRCGNLLERRHHVFPFSNKLLTCSSFNFLNIHKRGKSSSIAFQFRSIAKPGNVYCKPIDPFLSRCGHPLCFWDINHAWVCTASRYSAHKESVSGSAAEPPTLLRRHNPERSMILLLLGGANALSYLTIL
jgi:hypothetical protein